MKFESVYSTVQFKAAARAIKNKFTAAAAALLATGMLSKEAEATLKQKFDADMKTLATKPEETLAKLAEKKVAPVAKKAPVKKKAPTKGAAKGGTKAKAAAGASEDDDKDVKSMM